MFMKKMVGPTLSLAIWMAVLFSPHSHAEGIDIVVYKSPTCGCCSAWVDHLNENGFTVRSHNKQNIDQVKNMMGVPKNLRSCHTAKVGGYLIEGHVPAESIKRMLTEKPQIQGLAVPGMPMGSPGMEGPRIDPYDVVSFGGDGLQVYESKNQ